MMSPSRMPFPNRRDSLPSLPQRPKMSKQALNKLRPATHTQADITRPSNKTTSGSQQNQRSPDLSEKTLPSLPAFVMPHQLPSPPRPLSPVEEVASNATRSNSSVNTSVLDEDIVSSTAPTYQTDLSSTMMPALQVPGGDPDGLEPLADEEIDPGSFDLVVPANANGARFSTLEQRSKLLFSREHLQVIFDDAVLLHRFATFLCAHRPASVPLFTYYLEALKALRAIKYSNAVAKGLEALQSYAFTTMAPTQETVNHALQDKADAAFDLLVREDLPAYITWKWIDTVTVSIKRRITGTLPTELRNLSEGLAEVFCLTDPSRHDNPIIFASEEFHKTTQYGMSYVIGRNCRFLQGPATNGNSVTRIKEQVAAGQEHFETLLNYRRDGSPFMNLVMLAPLVDSRGKVRYHLGAQIDVSGLVKECHGLESFNRLIEAEEGKRDNNHNKRSSQQHHPAEPPNKNQDPFSELSELFNTRELETVRQRGGHMQRPENQDTNPYKSDADDQDSKPNWQRPRVLIQDGDSRTSLVSRHDPETASLRSERSNLPASPSMQKHGRLTGMYEHYLLVRPAPSLRVLFASPSLRVPGMLQSHFLNKIGGSERVREELGRAMEEGNKVTAKVRWVSSPRRRYGVLDENEDGETEGRSRWIHCTPLLGSNRAIGAWMVVVIDDETEGPVPRRAMQQYQPRNASLPNGSSAVNGARIRASSTSRSRYNRDNQDRGAVQDYHSVTRALHQPGSSSALRSPARKENGNGTSGKEASGFGFSGVDMSFGTPALDRSMGSQNVQRPNSSHGPNANGNEEGRVGRWGRAVRVVPERDETMHNKDEDDVSVASSNFTVRLGDD